MRRQISYLKEEYSYLRIEEQVKDSSIKVLELKKNIKNKICTDLPNAFWERKRHSISLPYEPRSNEKNIPTKVRPTQMNSELLEHCKNEIQLLLEKRLIRPSKSP